LLFNSGTSALHAAYFSINIPRGSAIAAPVYTYPATVMPMLGLGLRPLFCDANPTTSNIAPESVYSATQRGARAVVVTHMWGLPCEMETIAQIAGAAGIPVIEDISHAPGATYRDRKAGVLGDVAAISFQAFKLLWAGEGGALLTSNREIYERAVVFAHNQRRISQLGATSSYAPYAPYGFGLKLRIHPLGAVLALESLRNLPLYVKKQRAQAQLLDRSFHTDRLFAAPAQEKESERVYYTYKPLAQGSIENASASRFEFVNRLRREGIPARIPDSGLLANHAVFRHGLGELFQITIPQTIDKFPGAEDFFRRAVTIPFPNMATMRQTRRIARIICDVLKESAHREASI